MKNYNVWDLISKLRDLNDNYKYRYREYEAMTNEVTIQAAIELYADDATQVDTKSEKIIGVSSEDKTLQQDLNDFLESINVESSVWNWAYAVAQYGDFFIKLHVDENDNSIHVDDSIDPASVIDLFEQGQRVGFAEEDTSDYKNLKHKSNPNGLDLIIYSPDRFVHFMIKRSSEYDSLEIPIQDETDENGDPLIRKFTIVRGISMIEGVRSIYRMLQLLEDSLITARVSKAEYIRVFNIEVGDSTPKQAAETVNTAKNLFDSKATFDTRNNTYRSDKIYRPMGDPVFNPTRNGKGALSIESIGGDFQVKDIADLDYFKNKLFSGLKIPSAYLGYEECFRYDTKVTLLNGSTYEIGYMAEHPEDFIGLGILSCSPNGEIIPTRIVHVKQTRKNATFVRVHLDNGEYIDVTPDHLMMMRDGSFQEAGSLSKGDLLMPFNRDNSLVVKVELLDVIEDAYDLGVEHENHTFALTAGVFVHNSLPGGLGEETLTRLDIRYSRSVKRVQNAIIVGIRDLCNIWLRLNGRDSDVNNFKIILQAPSTAEELGRLTEFSTKMNTINEITSTLSSNYGDYINLPKVFKVLFDKFINYPELLDGLEPELNAAIERYEQHLKDEVTRRKAEVDELTQSSDRDY